ncbi:M15 family metallopeptidase [Capnocytophaga gingivalis]|jgi:peptidase M15D, vanX D-ala-D-ala dipeptidase|uniref:M15 family metallopeptidase n=1 Tax=Capnocytophaga gingivalis TaxID=1017 RepID=UPI0028D0E33F|nr:M15 family metallopeptidase [Capnocytophaga gingivalis]
MFVRISLLVLCSFVSTFSLTAQKKQSAKHPSIEDKFVNIKTLSPEILLDMKYATADNFLGQVVYDCAECYLRKATAQALVAAQKDFVARGYSLKLFDCYRPLSVQKKMWKILPGTHYVANPAKGSKHNRGAAVDLTLVEIATGKEVDMGTPFDTFSPKAHHSYTDLPKEVLVHRQLLKEVLGKHNFKPIFSEWWHYEYRPEMTSPVEDLAWPCPDDKQYNQ